MKMRLFAPLALAALSASLAVTAARADDDPWEVRLRGVYLDPARQIGCDSGVGGARGCDPCQ